MKALKTLLVLMAFFSLAACGRGVVSGTPDVAPTTSRSFYGNVQNTLYIEFGVLEPVSIEIKVERWIDGQGFDTANPVIFFGVVDQSNRIVEYPIPYRCRVYFTKPATNHSVSVSGVLNGQQVMSNFFPRDFWVHETSFMNLQ